MLTVPQWLRLAEATQVAAQRLSLANADASTPPLQGCHVALLLPRDASLQTDEFEGVVQTMGARLALLDGAAWLREAHGRLSEAAQMLGRLYNLVDCCGMTADIVAAIEAAINAPVLNGLALTRHPLHLLADLMAAREASGLPFEQLRLCIQGDESAVLYRTAQAAARALGFRIVETAQHISVSSDGPNDEPVCDFVLDTHRLASRGRLQAASGSPIQARGLAQAAARYRRSLLWAVMQGLLK